MKKFLVLLFLLPMFSPVTSLAASISLSASGGSPIPAAFSASDTQSRALVCEGNVIQVLNQTSTVLAVGFGTSSAAPSVDYQFVPSGPNSGTEIRPMGGIARGTYFYVRGLSSITSGTVQIACTYEEQKK